MEDEVDVDIEGDNFDSHFSETEAEGLAQEQFSQSKSSSWILPWELDSSISPENREVIETMLLEEQYYLMGKGIPENISLSDANKKPKLKKSVNKSSGSIPASSSRWSKEESELFEKGLSQFGRRWTKIAKLVGSRNVLQVKSHARQYFKQKVKSELGTAALELRQQPPQPSHTCAPTLTNAVRIERLSDDEDVDITDSPSEDEGANVKSESSGSKKQMIQTETSTDQQRREENQPCLSSPRTKCSASFSPICSEEREKTTADGNQNVNSDDDSRSSQCGTSAQTGQPVEACWNPADPADDPEKNEADKDQDDEEDEEEELKAPEQEIEMDTETITEDEKQAIPEFFEGRTSKTPDRYLKIRNYILDQWRKSKPKYLNKTSVRPGLKNCGDVNCIGRIHTYLELIGAINFSCEQAVYNRPKLVDRSKPKEGKDVLEAYQMAQRLQSMRTRKRRVRDVWGNWCDAKDLEGQTYEHLSAEELAQRREEMKKQQKPYKMARYRGGDDPFQLIPCRSFEEDVQEPFQVIVCAETLLIMDMHAHVSRGEVIGLLGGIFNKDAKVLKISAAEPCNSVSTGLQCEMDPVSQTQACDLLTSLGLSVVGWYHSHPSFHPNPSVRDINTQDQFQSYFSRGGAPFIGMIVSPYDPANASPHSQTTCLLVKDSPEPSSLSKLPYRFNFMCSQDIPDWKQTTRRALWIIQKYARTLGSVQMDRLFRRDSNLTCLEKMLASLARYLEPLPEGEGDQFLDQIQELFLTDFICKQKSFNQETEDEEEAEEECLNISSKPEQSDDIPFDNFISREKHQRTRAEMEESSSPVLHLGSVLSSEHDYLL